MIRVFISITIIFCLFSCKSAEEYIEFEHRNYMKVKSDRVLIKLIPKKRKNNTVVNILYHEKYLTKSKITMEEYGKIKSFVLQIKQEDLELPQNIFTCGCGNNTISIKQGFTGDKFYTVCLIKKFHEKFYEAAELILKSAKLEIKEID